MHNRGLAINKITNSKQAKRKLVKRRLGNSIAENNETVIAAIDNLMKHCNVYHIKDRRIKNRHAAPCLGVKIRSGKLLSLVKRSHKAKCIDINRYGMALETDVYFKEGEKVKLDFRGKYIFQSNIEAIVLLLVGVYITDYINFVRYRESDRYYTHCH